MRISIVAVVVVCSLLWAVTGVAVLAIALHEHHHHHTATHDHQDAFELVLHCHDNGGSPHHDHELNAPLTVTRTQNSVHLQVVVSQTNDLDDSVFELVSHSNRGHSESRDLGPPVYLMHCVSLT